MDEISGLTSQAIAEKSAAAMWEGDYASQGLGMKLASAAPGCATLSMEVTQAMPNGHGACRGGFIFTLADSALAFACNIYNELVVAQQCSITFIAPGRIGDRLTAIAREVSKRGRSGLYGIKAINQKGEPIAEFRGNSRTLSGTHF